MRKPIKLRLWAVVGPDGRLRSNGMSDKRAEALWRTELALGRAWPYWRKQGFRCVRVTVTEDK